MKSFWTILTILMTIAVLYCISMYFTTLFFVEKNVEKYQQILVDKDFDTFNKNISKNAKIVFNDSNYKYKDILKETKKLFVDLSEFDNIELQISPDLEKDFKTSIFTANVPLRCFLDSSTTGKAAQVVLNVRIRRTILGGWEISEVNVLHCSDYLLKK